MKVLITHIEGWRQYKYEEVVELDDALGQAIIDSGFAVAAQPEKPKAKPQPLVETAEKAPAETTAKRVNRAKPRSKGPK